MTSIIKDIIEKRAATAEKELASEKNTKVFHRERKKRMNLNAKPDFTSELPVTSIEPDTQEPGSQSEPTVTPASVP